MIFESLSDRLQATFKKLRGHGKLTEDDVNEAMREVRMALLEADVNFKVVKQFIKTVKERAIGQDILETLTPAQVVIKIVDEELTKLMGGTQSRLNISPKPPTVIMMVGLQGAGKTTSAGKLGLALKKQGKRPLLVAADIYRPAAITQLQVLGKQLDIPVFSMEQGTDAVTIAKSSIGYSQSHACDVVIIDTAGRLQIDEKLMQELRDIKSEVHPHEILLVVDAMTGQESVNVAQAFNDALGLDGVVMTKLDGDARGGAALSVKAVTGVPIKFIGLGEKLEPLEPFHPDRMASRILGMGDVLSLVEKAQATFDMEEAKKMEKKLRKDEFTLDDFLAQMQQVKKLGSLDNILGLIPGMGGLKKQLAGQDIDLDGKEMRQIEAIIKSMTPKERANITIINGSRRKRIAMGSGTRVQDVNKLLKQFGEMKKMMKKMKKMQKGKKGLPNLGGLGLPKLPFMH
ncbi:MAG: signal recognition particle protein [Mitsuokella jalaludinii]|uniref:signal recognition particle protein n=1 Tax=Mitsuokella jalaludinii TaxID=187979 RepID=UPI00055FFFF4|nr:signal recognition particle protein [Mitsuokella jalaludinii]MCI6607224.1 signal recognition particle protein [Mitsuokella jalaludinii]MCI6611938.1 signal recognition particle protein [Mitsuokella jalaludinii]MCI7064204.1 signal recognition particle protein [Mitsuokella jalaludinii]MCI7715987.1 signal recognition particle protein [Mitsuokella jalaludinii]MCQ1532669.1 signal recognition particle protein [Mitsuokella jalaludinii]